MAETNQIQKIEREYAIPLRIEWKKVPRYKRANKAIKAIKEFLVRHMKIYDRDLNKIKIDKYLNEFVWFRGIKKPPAKIKVKAIKEIGKDKEIVKVELVNLPEKLKFKKLRETKLEKSASEKSKKIKAEKEAAKKDLETEKEDSSKSEEEKKASVIEEQEKIAKQEVKKAKHMTDIKAKQPKHQRRKALAK